MILLHYGWTGELEWGLYLETLSALIWNLREGLWLEDQPARCYPPAPPPGMTAPHGGHRLVGLEISVHTEMFPVRGSGITPLVLKGLFFHTTNSFGRGTCSKARCGSSLHLCAFFTSFLFSYTTNCWVCRTNSSKFQRGRESRLQNFLQKPLDYVVWVKGENGGANPEEARVPLL